MMLNSSTLRQIWLIIERKQTPTILSLSDSEILQQLQEELQAQTFLSASELKAASLYISSRIPLIRDSAESKLTNAKHHKLPSAITSN